MDDASVPSELNDLLHNGDKAREIREILRKQARTLSLLDAREIRQKMEQALEAGRATLLAFPDPPSPLLNRTQAALDQIGRAVAEADRVYQRKYRWETDVETNVTLITGLAHRAAALHKKLREHRREMLARDVEQLRDELAVMEREALTAWGVAREYTLPVPLEHRLFTATEAITNALKDADGSVGRKKQWEDAVAANIQAVESELRKLEKVLDISPAPGAPTTASQESPLDHASDPSISHPFAEEGSDPVDAAVDAMFSHESHEGLADATPPTGDHQAIGNHQTHPESPSEPTAGVPETSTEPSKSSPPPEAASSTPPENPRRMAKRIEDLIRDRHPIDRESLERLQAWLARLNHHIQGASRDRREEEKQRRARQDEIRGVLREIDTLLGQAEETMGIRFSVPPPRDQTPSRRSAPGTRSDGAKAGPAASTASTRGTESDELETPTEEMAIPTGSEASPEGNPAGSGQDGGSESILPQASESDKKARPVEENAPQAPPDRPGPPPEPLLPGAVSLIQSHLQRVRELLEGGPVPGRERRLLWSRFRFASEALRDRRDAAHRQALNAIIGQVDDACRLGREGNPPAARQAIQVAQKAVLASPLARQEKDRILHQLRQAWDASVQRQDALREDRRRKEREGLHKLSEHYVRWEDRKEGIEFKISRLMAQLDELKERQRCSTSIGYRVFAEQKMAETRNQIAELKGIKDQLASKIEDVRPRLDAAGVDPHQEVRTAPELPVDVTPVPRAHAPKPGEAPLPNAPQETPQAQAPSEPDPLPPPPAESTGD